MKMTGIVRCFAVFVSLLLIAIFFVSPTGLRSQDSNKNPGKAMELHPIVTTPEKTLEIVLNAFVKRDINTFMAYVPEKIKEQTDKWRDHVRLNALEHMTEKKHVVNIVGIQLQKIDEKNGMKFAYIVAKVEISKDFLGPGINIVDSQGKSCAIYKWTFRQLTGQGPWFYDEGGF